MANEQNNSAAPTCWLSVQEAQEVAQVLMKLYAAVPNARRKSFEDLVFSSTAILEREQFRSETPEAEEEQDFVADFKLPKNALFVRVDNWVSDTLLSKIGYDDYVFTKHELYRDFIKSLVVSTSTVRSISIYSFLDALKSSLNANRLVYNESILLLVIKKAPEETAQAEPQEENYLPNYLVFREEQGNKEQLHEGNLSSCYSFLHLHLINDKGCTYEAEEGLKDADGNTVDVGERYPDTPVYLGNAKYTIILASEETAQAEGEAQEFMDGRAGKQLGFGHFMPPLETTFLNIEKVKEWIDESLDEEVEAFMQEAISLRAECLYTPMESFVKFVDNHKDEYWEIKHDISHVSCSDFMKSLTRVLQNKNKEIVQNGNGYFLYKEKEAEEAQSLTKTLRKGVKWFVENRLTGTQVETRYNVEEWRKDYYNNFLSKKREVDPADFLDALAFAYITNGFLFFQEEENFYYTNP